MEKRPVTSKSPYDIFVPNKKGVVEGQAPVTSTEGEKPRQRAKVHSSEEMQARRDAKKNKKESEAFIEQATGEKVEEKGREDIWKRAGGRATQEAARSRGGESIVDPMTAEADKEEKGSEDIWKRAGGRATREATANRETLEVKEHKVTAAEMREARDAEEKDIEAIAKGIYEGRMRGEAAEDIDKMLAEKGIKPWTPEAEEFMKKWDWEQAEQAFKQLAQEREEAVVKANEAEPKKKIDLPEYHRKFVDEKFAAFNINPDMLPEGLKEDFETLTYGQRLLIAENLQQLTLGRIHEEAAQKFQEDTKQSKFLGRIWKGITKKYQIAKHEQATALDIKGGGMKYHGELLKQLVDGTKRTGLDAIEGKDGVLELQYVETHPGMTEQQKEGTKEFNRIATAYSKVPYEWSLDTATSTQKMEYKRMLGQFEKAKEGILKTEAGIIGDKDALLFVSDMESKIRLNQFFNTHPDAEKQLQSIESDSIWSKAVGTVVTERGMYFGAGLATRTFATTLLGAVGFPIAAMGMGGWMARKRAAETLRERGVAARHGSKDTSKEAANVVTADALSKKLEGLVQKINSAESGSPKQTELLSSLQVRLEYTKNKLDAGLVDFGSADRRIINQYGLMDNLTTGSATFAVMDVEQGGAQSDAKKDVKERLDQFLQFKDAKISRAQKDYLRKQMIYGAGLGVAAFAAGHYAADVLGPTEAHATTGGVAAKESIMKGYAAKGPQAVPPHGSVTFGPGGGVEHPPISPGATGAPSAGQGSAASIYESMPGGAAAKAAFAAEHAKEAAAAGVQERGPLVLDIGKRGPEGAFIDELKKHPEVAQRLGIKDIGKEAHTAWMEFAKEELKDPETQRVMGNLGYPKTVAGYGEMMRHIEHGKISLTESGGKLHMSINEDVEYQPARAKMAIPKVALEEAEDIPTGPQVFGEALPADAKPAAAAEVLQQKPTEAVTSPVAHVERPAVVLETFVNDQFGLDGEEYNAIKGVQVEKLLKQIPSREEAWAIWRREVPGKEITLPHDGIYGAMEFKKHIDLAEHIRSLRPNAAAMQGDVDSFMKAELQGKGIVAPAGAEHGAPSVAEVRPVPPVEVHPAPAAAVAATGAEDIPHGQQIFGSAPHVESVAVPGAMSPEKLTLLNDDIYRSKVPVQKLITQYKVGNITAEDFANYYSEKVANMEPSTILLVNIKKTFQDAAGQGTPQERLMSQRALEVMVKRLQGIK